MGRKQASSLTSGVVPFLFWMVREGMSCYDEKLAVSGLFSLPQRDVSCEKAGVLVGRRQIRALGCDKLSGQGDFNRVTILIKHIQS